MSVEIDSGMALRIAELLDLFAELPSTPPILADEARQHVAGLMDLISDEDLRPRQQTHSR
ncbi:MAG: hypothetical protein ACRDU8_00245 [Egibacteraceae bacterium]